MTMSPMKRTASCLAGALMLLAVPGHAAPTTPVLHDLGPAPDFVGIKGWLGSPPLTMAGLRGKVVLVDFWAYSCINCIRTLPFLEKWQKQYGSQGLVIVGVHAPEFRFETNPQNIQSAMTRFGINYPVAMDNDLLTWAAFHNQYWPAEYLINRSGDIVYTHAGEGDYGATENAIRTLLGDHSAVGPENGVDLSQIGSPEMYFGSDRIQDLASPEAPRAGGQTYTAPTALPLNKFALVGHWNLSPEHATLVQGPGRILLHCQSTKIFMVASSAKPVTLTLTVDGKRVPDVTISGSRLYTLFDGKAPGEHALEVKVPQPGLEAFTFTFG